jgi:two-component sensor histidine kinase
MPKEKIKKYRKKAGGIVAAILITGSCMAAFSGYYVHTTSWVEHTLRVRLTITNVRQGVTDAETSIRGYLLTHKAELLDMARTGAANGRKASHDLVGLVTDNPNQHAQAIALRSLLDQRMDFMWSIVDMLDRGETEEAERQIKYNSTGMALMKQVRDISTLMEQTEETLLQKRSGARSVALLGMMISIALVVVLAIIIILISVHQIEADFTMLRGLADQKDYLLKELNHRVKNNLQQVSSLLSLQLRNINSPHIQEAIRTAQDRIGAIARVHQHLYVSSVAGGMVRSVEYFCDLCKELEDALEAVIDCHIDPIEFKADEAVPLGLLVNELITNSAKHGRRQNEQYAKVEVVLSNLGGTGSLWRLTVKDEGPGFSGDLPPERYKSVGMRLLRALVIQLGAEITFDTNENGTTIIVTKTENLI